MGVLSTIKGFLSPAPKGPSAPGTSLARSPSASTKAIPALGCDVDWGAYGSLNPPNATFNYAGAVRDFTRNGTVAICLRWLGTQAVSGPRLCVGTMDRETGEYKDNPDHELVQAVKRPNPFYAASSLIASTVRDLAYPGYSYWVKAQSRGKLGVVEYYWVPRWRVRPIPAPAGAPYPLARYEITPPDGGPPKPVPVDQVVHFRNGQDPYCAWQGFSAAAEQIRSVAALNFGEEWTAGTLMEGHRATVFTPHPGGGGILDEKGIDKIRRRLMSRGGIAGIEDPIEMHEVGFSPEEALIDRILDRPEGMVCAAFGLNPMALCLPSSAETRTYSNMGEALKMAAMFGLVPLLAIVAETLQTHALPDFEGERPTSEVWWDYAQYQPLNEDINERSARATQEWLNDGLTWDEYRDAIGRPAVGPPDGEMFHSQLGMRQAIEIAQQTKPVDGGDEDADEPDDSDQEDEPKPRISEVA